MPSPIHLFRLFTLSFASTRTLFSLLSAPSLPLLPCHTPSTFLFLLPALSLLLLLKVWYVPCVWGWSKGSHPQLYVMHIFCSAATLCACSLGVCASTLLFVGFGWLGSSTQDEEVTTSGTTQIDSQEPNMKTIQEPIF